ncbi:putative transketolase N-terminal section [Paraburkholderia piptadeniae]|uniref:Transketolase n=2 Tax=Paraburkholderia TaxID=1822464 RepID=A0A7X1NBB3_9BURK|nr:MULTISPECIES: transketolase [Paraburkholderia]MPW18770.1 transketolase [Paraburkholderia franconis]SIT48179.1 putative transketolase N-terminal section [Paraburkholderia piptadeniae]
MADKLDTAFLKHRASLIRTSLLQLIAEAGTGHPASSLSCVEILVSLYYGTQNVNPESPLAKRDMVVLSKGHAVPALYSILLDLGILTRKPNDRLRAYGCQFQGHPDTRFTTGIDVSTGSLGQGLSIGLGYVLGTRMKGSDRRAFVILGDGECQEGQVWEAALLASAHSARNLYAIVDYNKIQHDGAIECIVPLEPFVDKWNAFGWRVLEVDGHDFRQLEQALSHSPDPRPTAIIAHTIKGKGVGYMEGNWQWHSVADADRLKRDFSAGILNA